MNYDSLPQAEVPTIIYDMLSLKDSNFLVKANHKGLRFGLLKDGKVTQLYNSFSDCVNTNDDEEVWSVFCSNTKTKLRPDRTKMLNATYFGGVLNCLIWMIIVPYHWQRYFIFTSLNMVLPKGQYLNMLFSMKRLRLVLRTYM